MKVVKGLSSAVLLTLLLGSASAVYADETPEYMLGELVVTATRTPVEEFKANANISVVTRDTIEKNHYSNVQDALRDIPGVTIAGYGNTGEVYSSNSLILNGSDKVVVLIDGVRANINGSSSTYGKMATSELSNMDSIERIEVLKSSASTLYGADAAGGVINIITRKATENGVSTKLAAAIGSFGKERYNLTHRGNVDGFYWDLSLQKKISGNFKDGWGREIPEHLNSETNMYKIGKKFNDNADISVTYQTYDADYLRPTGGWNTVAMNKAHNQYNTGTKNNSKLNIVYTQKMSDKVTNQLALYRNKHAADEITWKNPGKQNAAIQPYVYHYSAMGLSDQVTVKANDKHTIVGGFEWYKDKVDNYMTSASSKYSDKSTTNKAIYLNDEFALTDTWSLSYGVRYNDDSNYGSKWLPSIVLGNTPNDKLNYYLGFKKFFVAPYPSQLYGQYGTPDLNPETGSAFEGGVNYRFDPTFVSSVHVFRRDMKDTINYDSGTKKYLNSGEETATGFDVQVRKAFDSHLSTNVGYTYTYIKPTAPNKNPNSDGRVPRSAWNIGVSYDLEKFSANLAARGTIAKQGGFAKTYGDNTSAEASSYHTYWVFDLGMNYKPSKVINIYAKCNNLFDRLYTEQRACLLPETGTSWYSAPGRNFEVGVEYTF